jgi:hypothetical protein
MTWRRSVRSSPETVAGFEQRYWFDGTPLAEL